MKKQLGLKVTATLLVGSLLLTVLPAQAQEQSTPKEEVVYANLYSDGTVQGIYVVNNFVLDKAGKIVDYGDYTVLRNMTSSEELHFTDQKITIEADAGRLYYEGVLDETALPWNFEIKYWLDGVAISAEELAGKQGHLQIDIGITQNKDCSAVFFENYALQVTLQLDTDLCRNIQGEGATMANVGSKKQLTYTVLPGQEERLSLSADVINFTMEQISLNGVTLQMALDVDESRYPQLKEDLQKIERTAVQFDEGALELFDGMEQLRSGAHTLGDGLEDLWQGTKDVQGGANDLQQGSADLQRGARSLYDGAVQATDGAQKVQDGAQELDSAAQRLQAGTEDVWRGATELDDGMAEALNGARELNAGADSLEMQIEKIEEQSARLEAALEELRQNEEAQEGLKDLLGRLEGVIPTGSQLEFERYIKLIEQTTGQLDQAVADLEKLSNGIHELYDGIVILRQGSEELLEGIEALKNGAAELKQGTFVLQDGTVTLYEGVVQLKDGSYELLSGATELHSGTLALTDGLIDLENGVVELCDGAIALEEGIVTLEGGLIVLQGGTLEFRNGTANLDGKMLEQLRQGIRELFGDGGETVSFVSEENTQVQSVQFVIRTPAIEIDEETAPDEEETQKLTFWQKLLKLFGIKV